jgi:acetyl-CoA carboxylase biotin carboxyl carrier protein
MALDLEQVESLLKLMREYRVSEVEHEADGSRLRVALEPEGGVVIPAGLPLQPAMMAAPQAAPAAEPVVEGKVVKSPMVGTFYAAAKPGTPPFVSVGDKVSQGQTLCIVEAMKLMNQIEAEFGGTLAEIMVENESPVQFGQPLFRITTD